MIERVRKILPYLLLAPALIPLVYVDGLLYPFVAPKTFLFRGLGIVAFAAFVLLALSGQPFFWGRLRQRLTWIPAALLAVAYATSLSGVDFYRSFWSVYDRGDGLLTLTVAVFSFYFVLLSADKKFLQRLLAIAAWVGTVAALYVFLQWIERGTGVNLAFIADTKNRLGGTLGNAAFLSSYLGMTAWATLATLRGYRGIWKKALSFGLAIQFAGILIAATRGTLLALFVAGFFASIYFAWRGEGRTRTLARIALIAGIALAALFFGFREQLKQVSFEPVRRIASVSLQDPTVSSRLFVWSNVFQEGMKQPFTGYGAEHIDLLFNRVYDPSAILEQWFDRTHNAFLDYLVQFGILGAVLYAGLIGSLGYLGLKLFHRGHAYGVILLLITCVYAVQNFFVFDTAMTLWFLLAVLAASFAYLSTEDPSPMIRKPLPQALPLVAPIALLFCAYLVVIQPLRANILLAQGYTNHVIDVDRAIAAFDRGLALGTYADVEYGYQAYSMYTDHQQTMLTGQQRIDAYRYALRTLSKNFERYPYDARTAVYLAHVLDSAPPGEVVDETFLSLVLTRAIELSPKRIQPRYIMSNIALKKGDKATDPAQRNQYYRIAIGVLEEYARQVPNFAEPRFIIATLYVVVGDRASGKRWADEGLALYKKGGKDTAQRAVRYYLAVEDWANVRRFLADILAEDPEDYPTMYDLAKAEFLVGNRERALEIFQVVSKEAPDLVKTDPTFLKALGQ